MLLELRLELVERREAVERGLEAALRVLEIALPETLQALPLALDLVELLDAAEARQTFGELAVDQEVGHAMQAPRLEGLLVLPLGAGDRHAALERLVLAQVSFAG